MRYAGRSSMRCAGSRQPSRFPAPATDAPMVRPGRVEPFRLGFFRKPPVILLVLAPHSVGMAAREQLLPAKLPDRFQEMVPCRLSRRR